MPTGTEMVEIDKYGRIKNRNYRPEPISGLRRSTTRTYRTGFWGRFDSLISDIGDWFDDNRESIGYYLMFALAAIGVIIYIIYVIHTWVEDGFFMALLAGVIGGVIGYYGGMLALGIIFMCMQGVCIVLRLIFKNATWFTTCLVIAAGITIYALVA